MGSREQMAAVLLKDLGLPERWWWLSFADPHRPVGTQFLGVAIVSGRGLAWACRHAHELGINPGGEVQGTEFPEGAVVPARWTERLLTKVECALADEAIAGANKCVH